MSDIPYRYWAFISYSSKDARLAAKLHRQLETYRIPRQLVGRPGRDVDVPRKLFPVFRDRDELPLSSDLGSSIESALRTSRYLVVICSPDAAKSRWVNEEIRYFKSLGREDRILAIISRGIPNGTDNPAAATDECFPPVLRFKLDASGKLTDERTEPIAGDLRKSGDGSRNAFLKAVAGITGMGFDAFAKREAKRALRRRIVLAFLGVVLLSAGLIYWDYSRLKVRHFAFATERWGVPEGVTPLTERARAGRELSLRFRVPRLQGPASRPREKFGRPDRRCRDQGLSNGCELSRGWFARTSRAPEQEWQGCASESICARRRPTSGACAPAPSRLRHRPTSPRPSKPTRGDSRPTPTATRTFASPRSPRTGFISPPRA